MASWYRTGTVAVTNGSKTVTGTAAWVGNVQPGDEFEGPDGKRYEVDQVVSNTGILLVENYAGTTVASGGAYKIIPTQGRVRDMAAAVLQLINDYGALSSALTVNSTNIGIGVSPLTKLHIVAAAPRLRMADSSSTGNYDMRVSGAAWTLERVGVAEDVRVEGGNAGFGTTAPGARLDVKSQMNVTNGAGTSFAAVKGSVFGYASAYSAVVIGATSGNVTTCIGVDPVANPSAGFTGNGIEVMFRNGARFISPDASNVTYHEYLTMADGHVLLQLKTAAPTLVADGEFNIIKISNTVARFRMRGSDGVTRSFDMTLAP